MSKRCRLALLSIFTLVLLTTLALCTGRMAPALAELPVLITEDGRLIPMPVPHSDQLSFAQAREQIAPKGTGVLVKRVAAISPELFQVILADAGYPDAEGLLLPQWWRVTVPYGKMADEVITHLESLPMVELAEEDRIVGLSYTPNDPYYATHQWGPQKVQAPAAWDLTRGSANVWIAILDSGIDYTHSDRPADLWLGTDFVNRDNDPWDDRGHGTHVAGIVAARTNNGVGIAGMCPNCGVVVIKVLGADGSGLVSNIANGIRFAADAGAYYGKRTVINLSLGGS